MVILPAIRWELVSGLMCPRRPPGAGRVPRPKGPRINELSPGRGGQSPASTGQLTGQPWWCRTGPSRKLPVDMADLEELVGQSPAIMAVRSDLRRILGLSRDRGRLPAILILGETGTGKGLVARLLHRLGPRAGGPFVDLNCATIPEPLLEGELFGFERGAFTDARRAKAGLFQSSSGGVLVLDEVGLLPPNVQAKVLTALEEKAARRLGSTTKETFDSWIVSATNTDLEVAGRERRFRGDLYHRLAVLTVRLPPLRERAGDAVMLAERFLGR